jgi:hypothetical protein
MQQWRMTVAESRDGQLSGLKSSNESSEWLQTPRGKGKVVSAARVSAASSGRTGAPRLAGITHL